MNRQPKIDEMIAFLEKRQPQIIQKIRTENPGYLNILKEGEELGPSTDIEELKVRAKVCFASTEAAIKICNENLPVLKSKLKGVQKLQMWGQVITTIGGASVLATLALKYTSITYYAGGLSLLGSLIPLILEQKNKGLDKNKQVDEIYTELIKLKLEAERNATELKFFIENNFNVQGISDVINRCNQIYAEVMERQLLS